MRARDTERNLLMLIARAASPQRDQALSEALAQPVDWQHLLDLADLHGCVALLAAELATAPRRDALPDAVRQQLTALTVALSLRRQAQLHALGEALDALAAQDIRPVLLKGAALATNLYTDAALRPFQDIDLLPRTPAELRAAGQILCRLGYVPGASGAREFPGFHTVYVRPAQSLVIELHADLLQLGLPMRTAHSLWNELEPLEIEGRPVYRLGLAHQMLHLCVHLHTHGYGRLIWLKDLDLLVRAHGASVDWERVGALAAAEGATISVRHALLAVRDVLGTPLPESLRYGWESDMLGEVAHRLLWPPQQVRALHGKQRLRSVRFNPRLGPMGVLPNLMVMGRRGDKLRAWICPHSWLASSPTENIVESLSDRHYRGGVTDEEAVFSP